MNQQNIGKFIAQKRKEQNLTQEQLAQCLGVSNKTVSKWETGKCMPDYSVVKGLCAQLHITVAELLDGAPAEKNAAQASDEQVMELLRRTQALEKEKVNMEKVTVSRFKGLGEMSEQQLWETTLNPETRRLMPVTFGDMTLSESREMFDMLMGRSEAAMRRA